MSSLLALVATWADIPALLTEAFAPVDAELAACMKKPHSVGVAASRARDGTTTVFMPIYGVGHRGCTPEERCLSRVVARVALPALPPDVAELSFAWPMALKDPAWDTWRDASGALLDHAALGACTRKAVRVVLDLRRGKTTAWLPAWQFKADRKPRACLVKALAKHELSPLPPGFGLQLAINP